MLTSPPTLCKTDNEIDHFIEGEHSLPHPSVPSSVFPRTRAGVLGLPLSFRSWGSVGPGCLLWTGELSDVRFH